MSIFSIFFDGVKSLFFNDFERFIGFVFFAFLNLIGIIAFIITLITSIKDRFKVEPCNWMLFLCFSVLFISTIAIFGLVFQQPKYHALLVQYLF